VSYYDNPAGRLHDLLTRLAEQNRKDSVLNGWAAVLGVDPGDVVMRLGRVAELVRQTQEEVDRAGEDALPGPVQRYRDSWARPIFPRDQAFDHPLGNVLPGADALEVLALVSAQLHAVAPEGPMPDENELEEMKLQLRSVIDAVQEAKEISADMKDLLIARLRGVEEAIEHLDVGGPSAIRHATEAVMGSLALEGDTRLWQSPTFKKVCAVLFIVWNGFTAGPEIQNSIDAWGDMLPQLSAGKERSADGNKKAPNVSEPAPASDPDDQDEAGASSP
jgi:hypothetical protein